MRSKKIGKNVILPYISKTQTAIAYGLAGIPDYYYVICMHQSTCYILTYVCYRVTGTTYVVARTS